MTKRVENRRNAAALMEAYLEALIEKNPAALPLSDTCRATFNGRDCAAGDNELWHNTLVIRQRQTFIDPDTGEAVFFGTTSNETVERNETFPVADPKYAREYFFSIRLKPVDGKLTEIEEVAIEKRMRYTFGSARDVKLPDWEFEVPVPEEEQMSREELIQLVDTYWDCLEGSQPPEALRIHPDAQRDENGYRVTNHSYSFRGDFKHNKNFRFIVDKKYRTFPVVDTARGVIVSCCFMQLPNLVLPPEAVAAGKVDGARIVDVFKIKDGAICHVIALFPVLDCYPGWYSVSE